MSAGGHPSPTEIRSRLDHPVIDGDGHWVEFDPVFSERMRKVGGDKAADGFLAAMQTTRDALSMSVAERRRRRVAQPAFWSRQSENTLDRATAMMPRLLYERLDEIGSDFAIIYPTAGLRVPRIGDDATRRAVVRAHNIVTAEYFRDLSDRMTPAAIIPMHTPEEAIAELEYVTRELGTKVGMFGSGMSRRVASVPASDPGRARAWPSGTTCWPSTATTTTIRSGPSAGSWGSRRPSTARAATRACGSRPPTSSITTSGTSPPPATPSPRPSSWAGSPGASPSCASPSWRAAWAGRASSSATSSSTGSGATPRRWSTWTRASSTAPCS